MVVVYPQEVAETMEKQNLKEESIEFYNQVTASTPSAGHVEHLLLQISWLQC